MEFADALRFTTRIGALAEAGGHHCGYPHRMPGGRTQVRIDL
jgi:pterin-4a-carbinolamine dehydratase